MSIESVPYPTREISTNLPLFLSDIGAVAVPIPVTGTQTIIATKGSTYITYGSGTITFTDPAILDSVSGDYYKVIVGGTSAAVIGGVTYTITSPIEILRLVSAGAWITYGGLDASQITSGIIDPARLPSYVDDVLEFANIAAFPISGELDKIYVALNKNEIYRWSGSIYIKISDFNKLTPITLGLDNTANGTNASAVGYNNTASGVSSAAFGKQVITSVTNTQELGVGNGTARLSSVRVHGTGYVSLSLSDTVTALTDGGATVGAEADGSLMRNAYCVRKAGSNLFIDTNSSTGTITSTRINADGPIVPLSTATGFNQTDNAKIFHVSGTTTLTLPVASTLADGWSIGVVNVGGSPLTVNRSNTNTINGTLTTFTNTVPYSAFYIYKSSSSTFVAIGILY